MNVIFVSVKRTSICYRVLSAFLFLIVFYQAALLSKEIISYRGNTLAGLSDHELNRMGFLKLREGEYKNAQRYFLSAIRKNPSVKYYYNNISVACIKLKDYKKARKYLQVAIAIDPAYVKALSNMAVVCFYQLRFREAYHYYSMARRVDDRYIDKRFEFGRIVKGIERIQDENPENSELKLILRYLKRGMTIK
jgi:tetratricopeptide (TPR) repeat protein